MYTKIKRPEGPDGQKLYFEQESHDRMDSDEESKEDEAWQARQRIDSHSPTRPNNRLSTRRDFLFRMNSYSSNCPAWYIVSFSYRLYIACSISVQRSISKMLRSVGIMLARSKYCKPKRVYNRWNSTSSSPHNDNTDVHSRVRALLRETAQPVAVITSYMPSSSSSNSSTNTPPHPFHGATLSSFASISMSPHPLVAFSLRVPSRMATTLSLLSSGDYTQFRHTGSDQLPTETHLVANILSASQPHTALLFSRPDLHPRPFDDVQWSSTREGLPIIHGSLGVMSCRIVAGPWPLHDLDALGGRNDRQGESEAVAGTGGAGDVSSELFIARVVRVEDVLPSEVEAKENGEDSALRTLPLLYHRRRYATTRDLYTLPASIS